MSEYFDSLETRGADERQVAQFEAIRAQIEHVKANTAAYTESLKDVDAASIVDAESFSALPLTRKSELIELQSQVCFFREPLQHRSPGGA